MGCNESIFNAFIQVKVYTIADVYIAMGRAFMAIHAPLRVITHYFDKNECFHSNVKNVARDMVEQENVKGGTLTARRIYSFRVDVETARDAVVYFLSLTVKQYEWSKLSSAMYNRLIVLNNDYFFPPFEKENMMRVDSMESLDVDLFTQRCVALLARIDGIKERLACKTNIFLSINKLLFFISICFVAQHDIR